jgi:hypothetical protein
MLRKFPQEILLGHQQPDLLLISVLQLLAETLADIAKLLPLRDGELHIAVLVVSFPDALRAATRFWSNNAFRFRFASFRFGVSAAGAGRHFGASRDDF